MCGACTGASRSRGACGGVTRGQEPSSPPATSTRVCVHSVYIYICIYIYTYIYTLQAHPCAEAAAGAPQACAPRAHTCPCMHTSAHVCPCMQVHPRPPSPRTAQVCTPQVCMDPPQHPHGGCLGAPQSHNLPSRSAWVQRGDPLAPTGTNQRASAHGGPSLAPPIPCPPQPGWGGLLHPTAGPRHPGGGVGNHRGTLGSVWVFFLIKI